MPEFPVPLDGLISYVETLRPEAGPLDHLRDAVSVASRLDENSDALVGYFVDQARASGASWSQIGASLGVSKQAAQKRFVLSDQGTTPAAEHFSRFTPRARTALAAAGHIAQIADTDGVDVRHLIAGLLAEPDCMAAKILRRLETTDEAIYEALHVVPAHCGNLDSDPVALRALHFTHATNGALRAAVKAAPQLGHDYIGTEHLLIGALSGDTPTVDALAAIGLNVALVKAALAVEVAQYHLDEQGQVR